MKEHKTQILAVLALALAIGTMVPTAAFASEGGADGESEEVVEGGILLLAAAPQSSAANLFTLVNQIRSDTAFGKWQTLYSAQTKLAEEIKYHQADDTAVDDADIDAVRTAVLQILPNAKIQNTNAVELNNFVLSMNGYADWTSAIDTLYSIATRTDTSISGITEALIENKMSQSDIKASYDTLNKFINRVTGTLAQNVAKLYARVSFSDGFKGYRSAVPLVTNVETLEPYNAGAATYFRDNADVNDNKSFWDNLTPNAQNAVSGKTVEEALDLLLKRTDTANLDDMIRNMKAQLDSKKAALLSAVNNAVPTANVNSDSTVAELIDAANGLSDFGKFRALYDSADFIRIATDNKAANAVCGSDTTNCVGLVSPLNTKYTDQGTLMKYYATMLNAAAQIDNNVSVGLMTSVLPDTSVGGDDSNNPGNNGGNSNNDGSTEDKPNTPNAGIVGLFESGALDLGTITLIVSVAVAGLAGLGLIAKLYLKHKF